MQYPLDLILHHIAKRGVASKSVLDPTFEKQFKFIMDPSKLKAGFCTRRAGKSYGIGLALVQACLSHQGTSSIYVALTRESAKRIMFKDVLYVINRKHELGMEFNRSDLTVTFPNGSILYLMGMDSSEDEAAKALGQKFKLAVIDEAASFRRDLRDIVYKVLRPACTDLDGQIALIGTPSNLTKGLFFDVVHDKESGWSLHQWSAFDNPYIADKWRAEIDELKKTNPLVVETPWFKQMYLGQYVVDQEKLVYKFNHERNTFKEIPDDLTYVLGVDLGFNDPSAFVVCGYNEAKDNKVYLVDAHKSDKMIISDVAERISYLMKKYNPVKIVIDNAAKQSVEELKQRFSLPLTPADKHGKAEFIEIMNSEFIQKNLMANVSCETLFEEYESLIWDERASRRVEHPGCANHLADAALYAWRYCYGYFHSPVFKKVLTDEEKVDMWFDKQSEKLERTKNLTWIDQEYNELIGEE